VSKSPSMMTIPVPIVVQGNPCLVLSRRGVFERGIVLSHEFHMSTNWKKWHYTVMLERKGKRGFGIRVHATDEDMRTV
jgi:hypothetical protein